MDPSKNPNDPNRSKSPSGQQDTSGATPSRKVSVTGLSSLPSVEEFDAFLDQDVFSLADSERFTMSLVHGQDELPESKTRFDERDYQSHRRESFPHPHQPLKPMRSLRKKSLSVSKDHHHHHHPHSDSKAEPMAIPVTTHAPTGPNEEIAKRLEKLPGSSPPVNLTNPLAGAFDVPADDDLDNNSILNVIVSSLPPTSSAFSPRPHSSSFPTYDDLMEHYGKKVQFEVGGSPIHSVGLGNEDETNVEKKKHKSHRSQKYEDPQWRLRLGSEIKEDADTPLLFRDVDVADMADLDKDDLTSHRFGDAKGFRRHKFYLREPEAVVTSPGVRSTNKYDHSPHEIFVELDMLSGLGEEREWKETARWIKYEEDLEEGADRWGRPHVASLSFHSLLNLRRLIEAGVVLLDLEERDLPGVAYRVVDQMVINELVDPDCKGYVMRSLLLKHKHVNDGDRNWRFNLRRNAGSVTSLQNSGDDKTKPRPSLGNMEAGVLSRRNSATVTTGSRGLYDMAMNGRRNGSHSGQFLQPENHMQQLQHTAIDFSKISLSHLSEEDLRWMTNKESILRRIPTGAEATVVLVGRDDHLSGPALAFVRLAESVYMPNITEVPIPVRFIFILLGPSSFDLDYKEIGRSVATLMSNREFHDIAYKADDRKDLLKGIHEYLDESIVLPPGEYEKELFPFEELKEKHQALKLRKQRMSVAAGMAGAGGAGEGGDNFDGLKLLQERKSSAAESLTRTRRCFGGLIRDIKRRYPLYLSDFKDGLNVQCIAAVIFIAFAQICGSIAFGGLIETKTKSILGITETLFTSAIGGMMFALFSCQPLLIVGTSGPLVLFDESLFQFCDSNGIDFLAMRTWIGFWLAVIGVVFVAFEASVFVRFFTRFTQEIFASLVSLLFIMESLQNLYGIYESHPLVSIYGNCTVQEGEAVLDAGMKDRNQPNTALLCTILMFGTFYVAWILRSFRGSNFLTKCIRDTLGNFAVPIAIGSMVLADTLIKETVTQKLKSPKGFSPTTPRNWLVDPGLVKSWIPAVGLLPALLLFILVFMETSIAELIVSKKDNKLKKGTGFHMDVLLICCTNTVLCIFGLPWASVALVRAVAHMSALTVWSTNNPPGEKPKIVGIREQRLTNCIVSILTGASIAMASVLSIVPLAVLFGVFLFMGVSSMSGIEFFQRVALFFKQVENHPQKPFVRRVKTWKMHLFTGIQIFWLGVLWGVKYTVVALSFPFILLILVPFRFFVLKLIFSPEELSALDSGGEDKKEPKIIVEAPVSEKHEVNGNKVSHLTRLLDDKVTVDPSSKVELKVTPPPPNDRL